MHKYTECTSCRFCHSTKLKNAIDLGEVYPSDFVKDRPKMDKVPLILVECSNCGLIQLKHTVERDELYRQYWYRSSLNNSMVKDLQEIVDEVENVLQDGDVVVDIGCNDGIMLSLYKKKVFKVGYDPAENLGNSLDSCDVFVNNYFTADSYAFPKAKVVTAIAMFYDLPDILPFVRDVESILDSRGLFVLQLTDLKTTIEINAIDNIVHEHLEYYTLSILNYIFKAVGMQIIGVSYNKVNGGSIRVTCSKVGAYPINPNVDEALVAEDLFFESESLDTLMGRISKYKNILFSFLSAEFLSGKNIAVMSASTKGNTLLQFFGIDKSIICHAAEINKDKFGLKTVGTDIPIISEKESLARKPDYYLVLAWHFIDNFIGKHTEYLKSGGKFVVPLPVPAVYSYKNGRVVKDELR